MSATLNERNPNILVIPVGTQGASINLPAGYFRKHSRIKQFSIIDQAGVATSNSNYLTATLSDGTNNYASHSTKTTAQGSLTALVAGVGVLLNPDEEIDSPNTPAAEQETDIPAGTSLQLDIVLTGTGVTYTKAVALLEYYPL